MIKKIKLTEHASKNILEREISIEVMYDTINNPDSKLIQEDNRFIYMKLYFDEVLIEDMLLRVVLEEEINEITVVTIYKTSKIKKYIKGHKI
ncbi:MAG: hypothetical protein HW421_2202 [Ignavibacteria bacterium]|nr:hypothetical protein [Ignavibacteria bacterium]